MRSPIRAVLVLPLLLLLPPAQAGSRSQAASTVTSPARQFGASIGDDYFLATYTQLEAYWKTLDRESDRLQLVDIGRTEEGRTQWMAIVSAPENLARLERFKAISRRLALAEGLSDDEARALAGAGRAVVWIDGGLHADEVLGAQQLIETVYRLVSGTDPETERILRDVIVLFVHANPDGHELVATWYMREPDPRRRSLAGLPRLYQKYVGHDNNRDFYLVSQAETINMSRVLYHEWFPQIVYDHHQPAPRGTVMFAPPFRGPFNYALDPLIPASIDFIGAAMHTRLLAEGKGGVTMRGGASYSTWWNGGLRTTAYFHNQIGLLTETIGSPTPIDIPFVAERQLPSPDLPLPVAPQRWRFRQSIEYSVTANMAVLDAASRYRELLLFNSYRMGRNAIRRGSEDTWTVTPRRIAALAGARGPDAGGGARRYEQVLRDPRHRDPRGYILPSDQPDFPTAVKFVRALLRSGVAVHRAAKAFSVNGVPYPAGSFIVKTAQAFRPHVLDMFEPQDHPQHAETPGGLPSPPYDIAGWTLAYQMGVRFDRILDAFDGPFDKVDDVRAPEAGIAGTGEAGFLLSHHQNDAFIAVNRLLAAGEPVYWVQDRRAGAFPGGTGAMFVRASPRARAVLEDAARRLGIHVEAVPAVPPGQMLQLRPVRIGLWDRYGGSSSSGWMRWLFEQFEFPFELVYVQALDSGGLNDRFDAIVLPGDAVPTSGPGAAEPIEVPPEYRHMTGSMSRTRTVPRLKAFVEAGGTLIAMGRAAVIGEALGLPIERLVEEQGRPGASVRVRVDVPGSVLRVAIDNTLPVAYGLEREADVFVDNGPVFRLRPEASAHGVRPIAWFASEAPLRSGWASGQEYLKGAVAIVEARLGKGRVVLSGPEIAFRGQSHGTFKFLFNSLLYSRAVPLRPEAAVMSQPPRSAEPPTARVAQRSNPTYDAVRPGDRARR